MFYHYSLLQPKHGSTPTPGLPNSNPGNHQPRAQRFSHALELKFTCSLLSRESGGAFIPS